MKDVVDFFNGEKELEQVTVDTRKEFEKQQPGETVAENEYLNERDKVFTM